MPRQVVFSALVSTFVAGSALVAGCAADGDDSILVLSNVRADDMCVTTATGTQTVISHGSLDTVLTPFLKGYLFFADLKSRITALDGAEDQRTIIVTGVNVDITFPGSTLFSTAELADLRAQNLTHFNESASTVLTPNGGLATLPFQLVPESLVERIVAKVAGKAFALEANAVFTVLGDMSGQKVASQAFSYGVTIGTNVVVNNVGACSGLQSTFVANKGYACNPVQDGELDCCTSGSGLVCPAVAEP